MTLSWIRIVNNYEHNILPCEVAGMSIVHSKDIKWMPLTCNLAISSGVVNEYSQKTSSWHHSCRIFQQRKICCASPTSCNYITTHPRRFGVRIDTHLKMSVTMKSRKQMVFDFTWRGSNILWSCKLTHLVFIELNDSSSTTRMASSYPYIWHNAI